jgi:hypothetical protein
MEGNRLSRGKEKQGRRRSCTGQGVAGIRRRVNSRRRIWRYALLLELQSDRLSLLPLVCHRCQSRGLSPGVSFEDRDGPGQAIQFFKKAR